MKILVCSCTWIVRENLLSSEKPCIGYGSFSFLLLIYCITQSRSICEL